MVHRDDDASPQHSAALPNDAVRQPASRYPHQVDHWGEATVDRSCFPCWKPESTFGRRCRHEKDEQTRAFRNSRFRSQGSVMKSVARPRGCPKNNRSCRRTDSSSVSTGIGKALIACSSIDFLCESRNSRRLKLSFGENRLELSSTSETGFEPTRVF